jgi:hypothetical protein
MRLVTATAFALLALSCGPEVADEPEALGTLEYEHSYARIHRTEQRVEIVHVQRETERRECGILTERAYTELEDTLAALEPDVNYGHVPEAQDCTPGARIHIEGFEHSPFACDFQCCQRELARAGLIYSLVEYHFDGGTLEFDGEPYVVVEAEEPCS